MDVIIGLGTAGCAIADEFSQYPQYEVFKIDAGLEKAPNHFSLPQGLDHEGYEKSVPKNFPLLRRKFQQRARFYLLFVVRHSFRVHRSAY